MEHTVVATPLALRRVKPVGIGVERRRRQFRRPTGLNGNVTPSADAAPGAKPIGSSAAHADKTNVLIMDVNLPTRV